MFASLRRVFSDETPGVRPKIIGIYVLLIIVNLLLWVAHSYLDALSRLPGVRCGSVSAGAAPRGGRRPYRGDRQRHAQADAGKQAPGRRRVLLLAGSLDRRRAHRDPGGLARRRSALASATTTLRWRRSAGLIGTSVSAFFLLAMADHQHRHSGADRARLSPGDARRRLLTRRRSTIYLNQRGFFARIFRRLLQDHRRSWKMYPVGFLFGLGFDTATEIGLFGIAATVGAQACAALSASCCRCSSPPACAWPTRPMA